jgi:DNA polymerase-3 subunit alpha
VSGHPLERWRDVVESQRFARLGRLDDLEQSRRNREGRWEGTRFSFGGIINDIELKFSKAGNPFAVVRIEDFTGQAEVMIIGRTYEKAQAEGLLRKGAAIEINARVELDDRTNTRRLAVLEVKELTLPKPGRKRVKAIEAPVENVAALELHISPEGTVEELRKLREMLRTHAGPTQVIFVMHHRDGHEIRLEPDPRFAVAPSATLRRELEPWLSDANGN